MFLLKLQYFSKITQDEPRNDIMHFFNKDLFPLLNKYTIKDIEQDYYDFKTVMNETDIIKSSSYNISFKKACQIFIDGISLCFDSIFLTNDKDKNINGLNELNKRRENFAKDVNILFRFEKVINENYQNSKKDQFILNDKFNIFNDKEKIELDIEPIENSLNSDNLDENSDIFPFKSPFSNGFKSDFIFDNKNFFINNTSSNNEKNNYFIINNSSQKNLDNNKNGKMPFNSINSDDKDKQNIVQDYVCIQSQNQTNYIKYKHKYTKKKKTIKEYKFSKKIKRENVDKKILRKFKKYLKHKMREKTDNEVKNYIKNNEFWPDYISMNLMPPFSYEKENISFKSFNSKYLCWFFDHKFSQELFNIFINKNYDDLLQLIMKDYEINEDSEDYKLLKVYINNMPMIYGDESSGSTTFSSNIAESDAEDIKINKENKNNNDMIIESENESKDNNDINFDYMSRSINMNININININNNDEVNNNYIRNDNFTFLNENNTEMNMNIESNIDMTDNCDINHINNMNINNSFEKDNPNLIQFDQNLFNKI